MARCEGLPLALLVVLSATVGAAGPGGTCGRRLKTLVHGALVVAPMPPNITGKWVSSRCEVRPGPQFITRSYTFKDNMDFQTYQFFYADQHCVSPLYTVTAHGTILLRQVSWITRGGTEADYWLETVSVTSHSQEVSSYLSARVNATCPGFIPPDRQWYNNVPYQVLSRRGERDCAAGLDFVLHELQLLRVERRQDARDGHVTMELFLGDIHTDRAQRLLYRPTSYQPPLVNVEVTQMRVTPQDSDTTSLLNVFHGQGCGDGGIWQIGREQDVTSTNGCVALGITLPHIEYELFDMERDMYDRLLLYIGQRPSDGTSPTHPARRATSYQTPLVQCLPSMDTPDIRTNMGDSNISRRCTFNTVLVCLSHAVLYVFR
ncbi:protein APCDD1-like isoform X2 [Branchiostoma floridae x Branchiostoma japonicum]